MLLYLLCVIFAYMVRYPAQIVAKVLYQEFPELATKVDAKIREKVPDTVLTDFSLISDIVHYFCALENINSSDLHNCSKSRQMSNSRRVLLAVILNLYNPEILHNLVDGTIDSRARIEIASILGISMKTVFLDVRTGRKYYWIYTDFKNRVDFLTSKFIEKYGNKENSCNSTSI